MSGEPEPTDTDRSPVEARDLTFGYAAVPVVEDVNLRVESAANTSELWGRTARGRARCSGSSWGSMSLIRGLRSCSDIQLGRSRSASASASSHRT